MLTRREKLLFHQIHPAKLAADIASSIASSWLLWYHAWAAAAVVAFLPAVVASAIVLRQADLDALGRSAFGRYVARHMTPLAVAMRIAGQLFMWIGAWARSPAWIVGGAVVVVIGWTYSLPRLLRRGT